MKLVVQPIDAAGHLWLIQPRDTGGTPSSEACHHPRTRAQLHMTTRASVLETAVDALRAGRTISLFARDATFTSDLQRIGARLAELGLSIDWAWADAQLASSPPIDDANAALEWFLANAPELLVVGSSTFAKRRMQASRPLDASSPR